MLARRADGSYLLYLLFWGKTLLCTHGETHTGTQAQTDRPRHTVSDGEFEAERVLKLSPGCQKLLHRFGKRHSETVGWHSDLSDKDGSHACLCVCLRKSRHSW